MCVGCRSGVFTWFLQGLCRRLGASRVEKGFFSGGFRVFVGFYRVFTGFLQGFYRFDAVFIRFIWGLERVYLGLKKGSYRAYLRFIRASQKSPVVNASTAQTLSPKCIPYRFTRNPIL